MKTEEAMSMKHSRRCTAWDAWNQLANVEITPTFRAAMTGTELSDATPCVCITDLSRPRPPRPVLLGPEVITRTPKPKKKCKVKWK